MNNDIERQKRPQKTCKGKFNPSKERLEDIAKKCEEYLQNCDEKDLATFVE